MDDPGRIIVAIIGLIATIISSAATHQITAKDYGDRIESLSRQHEGARQELTRAQQSLDMLQTQYRQLQEQHSALDEKYRRCVKAPSRTLLHGPLDGSRHTYAVATGDSVTFPLASSTFSTTVIRVSTEGVVLQLGGCTHPTVSEGFASKGDDSGSYVVSPGHPLLVAVSSDCCEKGLEQCDTMDLEEVEVECMSFDSDLQKAELRCRKRLVVR